MKKSNARNSLQVSPEFHNRLLDLQNEIRKSAGKKLALTDLTDKMVNLPEFKEIEKKLMNGDLDINMDISLRFDRRKK